jgi:hypothetical protein
LEKGVLERYIKPMLNYSEHGSIGPMLLLFKNSLHFIKDVFHF